MHYRLHQLFPIILFEELRKLSQTFQFTSAIEYLYRVHNILLIMHYVLKSDYMFRSLNRPSSGGTQIRDKNLTE